MTTRVMGRLCLHIKGKTGHSDLSSFDALSTRLQGRSISFLKLFSLGKNVCRVKRCRKMGLSEILSKNENQIELKLIQMEYFLSYR